MAMKGEVSQNELDAIGFDVLKDAYHLEVQNYKLPSMEADRSLVIIRHLR
jgi:hypothetical protein